MDDIVSDRYGGSSLGERSNGGNSTTEKRLWKDS